MLRRLYDISNVLCSLRLLEKVPAPTAKHGCRSAFKWLGAPPADQQYQPRANFGPGHGRYADSFHRCTAGLLQSAVIPTPSYLQS